MPCSGGIERDPRRWQMCLVAARAAMISAGWNKHAGKFMEVSHRKARRLYAAS